MFKNTEDLLNDKRFNIILKNEVKSYLEKHISRPDAKNGYKYKRNAIDILYDNKNMNFNFFKNNINDIWLKKSNLSSNIRNLIKAVCYVAYLKTLDFYKESEATND